MIIDVHSHIVPDKFPKAARLDLEPDWPWMRHTEPGRADLMFGDKIARPLTDQCWNLARRVSELPEVGDDRQVLSPMPRLCDYGLAPKDGLELSRYVNEAVAGMVTADPDHFYGLGVVPLQDPELAAKEIAALKRDGLLGIEITTNIQGKSPADPAFLPFWEEAERQGMCVFIHAQDPTFKERLVGPAYLENAVGFPIENTFAAASVITGGLLDRFPSLRVCFSHGAGGFPLHLPRLQTLWERTPSLQEAMKRAPTETARMLYYDDMVFAPAVVRYLMDTMGTSQIVIGSDYPLMARSMTPAAVFDALELTAEERDALGWKNALRFLGLDAI